MASAKAEAGLRPKPMAGASDARPLLNRAAVQVYMPVELGGDAEEKPVHEGREG